MAILKKKDNVKTPAQMRVLIAKDVLEMLPLLHPVQGTYLLLKESLRKDLRDAKTNMKFVASNCKVCALGACFLGWVHHFNTLSILDLNCTDHEQMIRLMSDVFDAGQLEMIEAAFEGFDRLASYVTRYPDLHDRLRAIMENIVVNKGTFVPLDNQMEASCTWGDGPDVLLSINGTHYDLTADEAIRLSVDLSLAAAWAKEQNEQTLCR
jgi:hypothetical protein